MTKRPISPLSRRRPERAAVTLCTVMVAVLLAIHLIIPSASAEGNLTPSVTPFITIDPIGDHTIGEVFFINGTTNLPVTKKLRPAFERFKDLGPSLKNGTQKYIRLPDIPVMPGTTTTNRWSINVTDFTVKNLVSTEYIFWVVSDETVASSEKFSLFSANNFTPLKIQTTTLQTTVQSPSPVQSTTSAVIIPSTTQVTPLPPVLMIAILGVFVIWRSFRERKR